MTKFLSLYSSSSGNSILISNNDTNILIDAGVSASKICSALNEAGTDIGEVDAILVTHEHSDHISGLGVLCRRYHTPIYATRRTLGALMQTGSLGKIDPSLLVEVEADESFTIKDLTVNPMHISHDAAENDGDQQQSTNYPRHQHFPRAPSVKNW